MRAPSSSGGKDWLGFLTDKQVISQWGKTGAAHQSTVLSDRPSRTDLQLKIDEKLRKGYRLIGEYRAGQGWSHLQQPAAPTAPIRPSVPRQSAPAPDQHVQSWLSDKDGDSPWF
jgi:hypothetical protein